jgi:hypothetical protein
VEVCVETSTEWPRRPLPGRSSGYPAGAVAMRFFETQLRDDMGSRSL